MALGRLELVNHPLFAGLGPLDGTATDSASLRTLLALVDFVRPRVILEVGTYRAHFAVPVARALPQARVHTFDPIDFGWDKSLAPNITFHQRDFDAAPEPFEFAFVDSGPPAITPDDDIRWRHWQLACALVEPGGLVVCHDTLTTDWNHASDIIAQGVTLRGGRGLTLWSKPL